MNEFKWKMLRRKFSAYAEGIYMNHAAISPMSSIHKKSLEKFVSMRSHLPVDVYPHSVEEKKRFKRNVARLINVQSEKNIAFTGSTSAGLNIVANGLPWKTGERIILYRKEFPANVYPFLKLERRGVKIDWLEDKNGRIHPEMIEKLIRPETRLLSISFVQFLNGFRADLKAIGEICRRHNIIFAVDGIQGLGVVPFYAEEWGIDVLSAGGHKWLMWPMGTGFVYLSDRILERVYPIDASWLSVKDAWNFFDFKLDFPESAEKFEYATLNYMGMYVANPILEKFLEIGIDNIHQRVQHLVSTLMEQLKSIKGVVIDTPEQSVQRAGILSVRFPDSKSVFSFLQNRKIYLALREGRIRFSPHMTNNETDIRRIVEYIRKITS